MVFLRFCCFLGCDEKLVMKKNLGGGPVSESIKFGKLQRNGFLGLFY